MVDLSQLKYTPFPGVPNVDEIEHPTGERCLSPSKKWSAEIAETPQGAALHALYMIMGIMGVPAHVILTIAAVKFADAEKKIDFEDWINNRSNWKKEDKDGAIIVLKTVDSHVANLTGKETIGDLPSSVPQKKPEDDWNLN